ncbi:1-acylglycerol-3-phosphate O-acyltransferase [Marinomonas agarivorans]|nr:1-acylglycerol-3-phosphate O-acyltransferase [Marinomonas agarivorans]
MTMFYGLLVFPFIFRSKNKIYQLAYFFNIVAPILGFRVESRIPTSAKAVKQAVYVGNHQNNADLFCLSHIVAKGVVTVGKRSLVWIPFFGILYWISGNFLINRTNRKQALATIDQIVVQMRKTELSIMMFPEGTRSRGRGLLPFKAGAFHAAIQAGVPIVPFVCSDTHDQVQLGRWNNGNVIVEVLDPISTEGLSSSDANKLMHECREKMLAKWEELNEELEPVNKL